jgi:hypothetical protein
MSHITETPSWYHTNKYTADAACEHCEGVVRHEDWCITCNGKVAYAYEAVFDAGKLTLEDQLILHALGVSWTQSACDGNCRAREQRPAVQ